MRTWRLPLLAAVAAASVLAPAASGSSRDRDLPRSRPAAPSRSPAGPFPSRVRFEPNLGQWDARIRFLGRGPDCQVMLADGEAVFRLGGPGAPPAGALRFENRPPSANGPGGVLRMEFVGASPAAPLSPSGLRPSVSHYFLGNDSSRWRSRVPHYDAATYRGAWPGVDLVFRGDPARLEYDLVLAPGADLSRVGFRFSAPASLDAAGDLVIRMPRGEVRQTAPRIFQDAPAGRREVSGAFVIRADGTVGFEAGRYDRSLPLVVDPKVSYASYLGGSLQDIPRAVAVAPNGAFVVTGQTDSTNFPLASAYQSTFVGATAGTVVDAFVTKYAADGQSLLFSTYYGGDGLEDPRGIACDPSGNVVVCGNAVSLDLPAVSAYQAANAGGVYDMFLVKFDTGGGYIHFSTYFGTAGQDEARDVACDAGGVYVSGLTTSAQFPVAAAVQPVYGGGTADAVLLKFNSSGTSLVYSTFYGGTLQDVSLALDVDSTGAAYLSGSTSSTDFPTVNPIQAAFAGGQGAFPNDAFCAKISPAGNSVVYATYLGGTSFEDCYQVAVTPTGEACLAGTTGSPDFPVAAPFQSINAGGALEGWCTKINAGGTALTYSTFIGGSGDDIVYGIASDSTGIVTLCGVTNSSNLATTNAFQPTYAGGTPTANDAFVVKISATGQKFHYLSYLGGTSFDDALGIALDGSGNPVIVGVTGGAGLTTVQPQQATFAGGLREGYVVRLVLTPPANPGTLTASLQGTGAIGLAWGDLADNETGYQVERKTGAGAFALLATVGAQGQAYPDFGVVPSTTYTYRVRAVNDDGSSAWTNEASVTTPASIPPPLNPNNLQVAVVSSTETRLTWNDRSQNEYVFEVQRRIIPGTFAAAANLPADTDQWNDTPLGPDTSLVYRVRAVGVTSPSGWTAEVAAMTPPTFGMSAVKAAITDSTLAVKDKAKAKGVYTFLPATKDGAIDPVNQGVTILVGGEENPAVVTIQPADPTWKVAGSRATWKSPKTSSTKVAVVFDLVKRTFSVSLSKITFPGPVANPVRLSIRVGNDAGSLRADWVNKKPGAFSYKQP